jgi:hypothetical protein
MNPNIAVALAAKNSAEVEITSLEARISALSEHSASASPAARDLAVLREETQLAFSKWSENPTGPAPVAGVFQERKLLDEIEAHRISTASSERVVVHLQDEKRKAIAIRDSAGKYAVVHAAVELVDAETPKLVAEINAAGAQLIALVGRLSSLREFALQEARGHDAKELFDATARSQEFERVNVVKPTQIVDMTEWRAALANIIANEAA